MTPLLLPSKTPVGRARAGRIVTHSVTKAMWTEDHILVTTCLLISFYIKWFGNKKSTQSTKHINFYRQSSCSFLDVPAIHSGMVGIQYSYLVQATFKFTSETVQLSFQEMLSFAKYQAYHVFRSQTWPLPRSFCWCQNTHSIAPPLYPLYNINLSRVKKQFSNTLTLVILSR